MFDDGGVKFFTTRPSASIDLNHERNESGKHESRKIQNSFSGTTGFLPSSFNSLLCVLCGKNQKLGNLSPSVKSVSSVVKNPVS
jgi:hypothetical protein